MGVADFPIEFLRALKITPHSQASHEDKEQPSASSNILASTSSFHARHSTTSLADSTSRSLDTTSLSSNADDAQLTDAGTTAEPESLFRERISGQGVSLTPSSTSEHRSILGKAIGRSSPRSRSHSPSRNSGAQSSSHQSRHSQSVSDVNQMSLDSALATGKGVGRIVGVGLKSPMDFTMSLARGFHNAPKLYGDESVRQTDKITGIQSGLKTAGKVGFLVY